MDKDKTEEFFKALTDALEFISSTDDKDSRIDMLITIDDKIVNITIQLPDEDTLRELGEDTKVLN